MNFTLFILIYFEIFLKVLFGQKCEHSQYLKYSNESRINRSIFSHFKTFDQLKRNCFYTINNFLEFIPEKFVLLDDRFSFEDLFDENQTDSIEFLQLLNIKGFDIHHRSQIKSNPLKKPIHLFVFSSKLYFYSNQALLDSHTECSLHTYNNSPNFFNSFDSVKLVNMLFPKTTVCPYAFKDSSATDLVLATLTNSFLLKNRLRFDEKANDTTMRRLRSVNMFLVYEALDATNFNRYLFKRIFFLTVRGVLNSIQADLFVSFARLKNIDFQLDNLREFLHTSNNNNQWLSALNTQVRVNMTQYGLYMKYLRANLMLLRFLFLGDATSFEREYTYPNEDFCLFKYFPHMNAVFPYISSGQRLNCTCTIYWLHSFVSIYKLVGVINATYSFCDASFNASRCDFEQRLDNCAQLERDPPLPLLERVNDVDVLFLVKWVQFVLLTLLQPVMCSMGVINNVLIVVVIESGRRAKRRGEFDESMYRFIEINAVFNVLYSAVTCTRLVNTCIFGEGSVFCSNVYKVEASQSFKVVIVFFGGQSLRFASNASYSLFALSRLILISLENRTSPMTTRYSGSNYGSTYGSKRCTLYFLAILLPSCLLSIFTLFQYKINVEHNYRKEFPYEIYDEFVCDTSVAAAYKCKLFAFFKILNSVCNDGFLVILNLVVDMLLLRNFHRRLDNKSRYIVDSDQHKNIQKSKKKINRMVFCNGVLYICAHLPGSVTTLLLIVYAKKIEKFCNFNFSCDLMREEAEFFSIVSIVFQFYIFKAFDKNFQTSFRNLKKRLFSALFNVKKPIALVQLKRNDDSPKNTIELKNIANLIGNGLID